MSKIVTSLKLDDLFDVEIVNPQNGSIIVYNSDLKKWISTNELKNILIDSGNY